MERKCYKYHENWLIDPFTNIAKRLIMILHIAVALSVLKAFGFKEICGQ